MDEWVLMSPAFAKAGATIMYKEEVLQQYVGKEGCTVVSDDPVVVVTYNSMLARRAAL